MPGTATKQSVFVKAHNNTPPGMLFHDNLEDVRGDASLIGYIPVVERAWKSLDLDGVLFDHGRPVLYLKESPRPLESPERIRLHRLFWNQGVANILVLADPSHVYIYSALAAPSRDDSTEKESALVQMLDYVAYAKSARDFLTSVATGTYYTEETHKPFFQPEKTVDSYLLNNLREVAKGLSEDSSRFPATMAHAFLGRLLFACYLLDRKIVSFDDDDSPPDLTGATRLANLLSEQPSFVRQREILYRWFAVLKKQFNGTMFDQDLDAERDALRDRHLRAVTFFLAGNEERTNQYTLGFWAYNFEMIPVETISAIYETFLAEEDTAAKRTHGAFYTPRFLAEMVLDVTTEGVPDITTKRCLDPACGSGIFLVTLFSRMATTWLNAQSDKPTYKTRVREFQRILRDRIRGVDVSETACRISCFSLYLAYLDLLDPSDIREHAKKTGKALPKLLSHGTKDPTLSDNHIPVVRCADALEDTDDMNGAFDVVVGNPPWNERPDRLAQRFAERVPGFLKPGGTGCLLLPTALLLNRTDDFQAKWLRDITLERVVNLADYRLLLFQNAVRPAFIARFRNDRPQLETATVQHDAPKFRRDSLREGCVTIGPADRSWIPLRNILAAANERTAPVIWKRHLWGTPRDQKFLDLLLDMPTLGNITDLASELSRKKEEHKKRWLAGQGMKPWRGSVHDADRELKPMRWPPSSRFLPAKKWKSDLVALTNDTLPLGQELRTAGYRDDVLYSDPDERLFKPPMVVVNQGFAKITFSDFSVLFQDTIQSISGPPEDQNLLMFLAAYLRSPLASYFLFHTVGSWGTERDTFNLHELLRLPFPLPGTEYACDNADRIVRDVASRVSNLRTRLEKMLGSNDRGSTNRDTFKLESGSAVKEREQLTNTLQIELNGLVYEYFGLTQQEIMLVEDMTQVFIPSSTPSDWWTDNVFTLDPVQKARPSTYTKGIEVYASTLTRTLNGWAAEMGSTHRLAATGGYDQSTGLAMVTLRLTETETDFQQTDVSKTIWQAFDQHRQQSRRKQKTLVEERDVVVFHGKNIYIVRPGILGNWTRTAALNDAAQIYGEIASARRAKT